MTDEPGSAPIPAAPGAAERPRHVHFLGICGYAVSGAAILAQQLGHAVTGSDEHAYPPVSDIVTAAGIPWENRHDPANLDRWGVPDLVVVGNQVRPLNEEWLEAKRRGLPLSSEVEFFVSLSEGRLRLSVCGTHGKTTTTALLIHMLARCGMDPGFRLGSTSLDLGGSARLGTGPFVFEGDEYTTAPWDPRPKFLHMRPVAACVTRLEWDHPDVYPSPEAYRKPFVQLAEFDAVRGAAGALRRRPRGARAGRPRPLPGERVRRGRGRRLAGDPARRRRRGAAVPGRLP